MSQQFIVNPSMQSPLTVTTAAPLVSSAVLQTFACLALKPVRRRTLRLRRPLCGPMPLQASCLSFRLLATTSLGAWCLMSAHLGRRSARCGRAQQEAVPRCRRRLWMPFELSGV